MATPYTHPEPGKDPWEQLPWETGLDYSRFLVYRDLGIKRTVRKVQAMERDLDEDKRPRQFDKICTSNFWVGRCRAWDIYQNEETARRLAKASEIRRGVNLDVFEEAATLARPALAACRRALSPESSLTPNTMKAANFIFNLIGYNPPEYTEEAKSSGPSPEEKARMLDVLTPTERLTFQMLVEKMRSGLDNDAGN